MFISKKTLSCLILSSLIVSSTTPVMCNPQFSKKNIIMGIIGTATVLMIGKCLCTLYFDYFWPHNDMIKYCQKSFNRMSDTLELHKKTYENDAHLSDWELKERICEKYSAPYQFMKYHTQLTQIVYDLDVDKDDLKKSLRRIRYKIEYLNKNVSLQGEAILQTLITLELQGSRLETILQKTLALLTTLKNRITQFTEYNADFHSFESEREEEQKERENMYAQQTTDSTQKPQSTDESTVTSDAFERVEQQIIQFNLDYY